jgi:hypothetical protein
MVQPFDHLGAPLDERRLVECRRNGLKGRLEVGNARSLRLVDLDFGGWL